MISLLNTGTFFDADIYTITLFGGGVLRFTTADFDVVSGGNTFTSQGIKVDQKQSKAMAHWKVGLDVDTWTVVLMPRPFEPSTGATFPDLIGSTPWLEAASLGALDGADLQVDRAYFATPPTWPMSLPPRGAAPVGTLTIFAGVIAEVDVTDAVAVLTVNDYRDLLSMQMPKHFFMGQCRWTLFDSGCQLAAASFVQNAVVAGGSTQRVIIAAALPAPTGSATYLLGKVVCTSGLNNTFQRTISNWDGANTLTLLNPLPFTVTGGDTFSAYPGCDKSTAACTAFGNLVNFGGEPYIPAPENAGV